jgi:hypothetical protein
MRHLHGPAGSPTRWSSPTPADPASTGSPTGCCGPTRRSPSDISDHRSAEPVAVGRRRGHLRHLVRPASGHTPSPSSTDCSSTAPHRCHGLRCRTFQPQTSTQATHSNSTTRAQPRTDTHPTPGGVNPLSPVGTPGVGVSRGPIPPSRNARWVLGDTVPRRAALGWGELDATSDFRYLEHAADRSPRHPIGAGRRCWCRSQPGGNPTATLGGASGGSARSTAATNSPLTRPRSPAGATGQGQTGTFSSGPHRPDSRR